MDDVVESGPAWESGVRKGDVIVTVNDWLIVLMDRAQVMFPHPFLLETFYTTFYSQVISRLDCVW